MTTAYIGPYIASYGQSQQRTSQAYIVTNSNCNNSNEARAEEGAAASERDDKGSVP